MTHDIYARLRATVLTALRTMVPDLPDDIAARVEVSPARDPAHGDMATNAALVAAKAARQPPAKLAAGLVAFLGEAPEVAEAAAAGPGFVNLRLEPAAFRALLPGILRAGEAYGDSRIGNDMRVNVEYVSANPTGPMHIGHCRGAVVGDALANLLAKVGYDVTKEYYINDAGAQVTALAWAAYWRYLQALGTPLSEEEFSDEVPGGLQYRGEYLIPVGERLAAQYGAALAQPDLGIAAPEVWIDIVRDFTIDAMMQEIRDDLHLLGVDQHVFSSERALVQSGAADATIDWLQTKGLIYEGVLEPPKGKTPEDWEPRPQTLFRATQFGDDVDRPLRKSDGSNTYFANDIAYHADKVDRGHDGADRRAGRRPRRLRQAHAGRGAGAVRRRRKVRGGALPDRAHHARRPAGEDVQARRQLRHAARPAGGGRQGRGALHHADAQGRRADGIRPGPGGGADPRQPGVLRAVRARPLPLRAARRGGDVRRRDHHRRSAGGGAAGQPGRRSGTGADPPAGRLAAHRGGRRPGT